MARERKTDIYIPLGRTLMTRGVADTVPESVIMLALHRHSHGDWGDVCDSDWKRNNNALTEGTRLFSSYKDLGGHDLWVITEADRSATTVLFPSEY